MKSTPGAISEDGLRLRLAEIPTALGLESLARPSTPSTRPARRARYVLSIGEDTARRCAEQAREVMDLILPELDPADSLVDWAVVTAGEFTTHLLHAAEGKITCELRIDGEHLYVSVEAFDRCGGTCTVPGGGRRLVDLISTDAGSYTTDAGKRILWAAAEIIPVETAAA